RGSCRLPLFPGTRWAWGETSSVRSSVPGTTTRLVVPEATLQREATQGELPLRIEGQNRRTGELREGHGFRQLVRHTVIESEPELLVVREAGAIVVEVRARVAELEAVPAGDVRDGRAPRVRPGVVVVPVLRAVIKVGDPSVGGTAGGALFLNTHEPPCGV